MSVTVNTGVSEVVGTASMMGGTMSATQITGALLASQIGSVDPTAITAGITAAQIINITATQVVGAPTQGQTVSGGTLIGYLNPVNLNTSGDQALTMTSGVTKYFVRNVTWTNATQSLLLAGIIGSIRTATGGGGTAVSTSLGLAGLVNPTDVVNSTLILNQTVNAPQLYLRLTSLLGGAGSAACYVFGDVIG